MSIFPITNVSKSVICTLLLLSSHNFLFAEVNKYTNQSSCFVPETKILMGDGLDKAIKDIRVGEQVLNPVSGKIAKVVNVLESFESEPIIEITVGNKTVKVTETHPVKTDEGTITARDVKRGQLVSLNGSKAEVSKVHYLAVKAKQKVFNIRLEGDDQLDNHMLLSNGIVTGDLTAMEIINQPVVVQVEPVVTIEEDVVEEDVVAEETPVVQVE